MSDQRADLLLPFTECFEVGQVLQPARRSLVSDEFAAPDEGEVVGSAPGHVTACPRLLPADPADVRHDVDLNRLDAHLEEA